MDLLIIFNGWIKIFLSSTLLILTLISFVIFSISFIYSIIIPGFKKKVIIFLISLLFLSIVAKTLLTGIVLFTSGIIDFNIPLAFVVFINNFVYKFVACIMNVVNFINIIVMYFSEIYLVISINNIIYNQRRTVTDSKIIKFIKLFSCNNFTIQWIKTNIIIYLPIILMSIFIIIASFIIVLIWILSLLPNQDFLFRAFVPLIVLPTFIIITILTTIFNIEVIINMLYIMSLQYSIFNKIEEKEVRHKKLQGFRNMLLCLIGVSIMSIGLIIMLWVGMFSSFSMFLAPIIGSFALIIYSILNYLSGIIMISVQIIYSILIIYSFMNLMNLKYMLRPNLVMY